MAWFLTYFDFVSDAKLKRSLASEFYAARYSTKLMEALHFEGFELAAQLKFQIIQYASIYEALITHLLWTRHVNDAAVAALEQKVEYKPVPALSSLSVLTYNGDAVVPCVRKVSKKADPQIRFDDKLATSVQIGLIPAKYEAEISEFYALRNSVHIITASRREIEINIEQSKRAYRRMKPVTEHIRSYLGAAKSASGGP